MKVIPSIAFNELSTSCFSLLPPDNVCKQPLLSAQSKGFSAISSSTRRPVRSPERCRAKLNEARTSAKEFQDLYMVQFDINTKLRQELDEKNSQHTKGQAADIASDNPHGLAELVLQEQLPFDQMIIYNTFVHISHKHPGPQREVVLYDEGYEGEKFA